MAGADAELKTAYRRLTVHYLSDTSWLALHPCCIDGNGETHEIGESWNPNPETSIGSCTCGIDNSGTVDA